MAILVESYEDEHYPIPESSPNDTLKFFMEDRGIKQSDLLPVFGSSGIASEVVASECLLIPQPRQAVNQQGTG